MRNFRNFHAKITPLIAVFALVAFSIFTFIKLPAFAQNSAQDLNKTEVLCGGSASSGQGARDLSKTEVSREHSASSAEHEQDGTQTPSNEQVQDLNKTEVLRKHSAGFGQHEQNNGVQTPSNQQASLNGQDSTQSVPSNEQAQTEQDSVITPPTAQDNCVQTHSAEQDLESNSPITHLNTQISAQVPLRVQSTTITPKASTGANIELSDGDETEASGAGWTYDSTTSVYIIATGANVTISGTTTNKRIVVASGNATVTLENTSITSSSGSPIALSTGANLTLKLTGSNVLSTNSVGYSGLNVPDGATVTIKSAEEGARLTATGYAYGAGIGGNDQQSAGTITINSGTVTATSLAYAAGIGGGNGGSSGSITISNATVTATGGAGGGAAIGGGSGGTSGSISISSATVTVTGGAYAAAIGGGSGGSSDSINITNSRVNATANGGGGAGIGGGNNGGSSSIIVNSSSVTTTGGSSGGAGIGGGQNGSGGDITITGGTVTATGGSPAAGIGGGENGSGGSITITDATVTAHGAATAAGIGGGNGGSGGTITITGGIVTATGGNPAAGIGGGQYGAGGNITITDASVTATGGSAAAGIGGGYQGEGGTITITGGDITATGGGGGGAGIGGGYNRSGGTITINGGTITATGGSLAAGIGGGKNGSGGTITINGGIVTANGGSSPAAGIGGGENGSGGDITITGGNVKATGGNFGAGIGGGASGDGGNITIAGGTVIAKAGADALGSIGGGNSSSTAGSTTISGGTVIGIGGEIGYNNTNDVAISGQPVILAPNGIKGKTASSDNRANGILIGSDVSIDTSGTPITITINVDMTIPSGADFKVPEGVKVVVPSEVTLTVADGAVVDIAGELENEGILDIADNADVVTEGGGQITGDGTVTGKFSGSDVSELQLASKTSTSITVNPATLLSETGQEVEYAISTTNELPASEGDWQAETTFTSLNQNTQYYIFARSKENTTHKAGTAQVLQVKTTPTQVAYTNADDTGHENTWWTFNSETGTLIINLENVYAATGSTSVEVVGDACADYSSPCRLSIQHVVFANAGNHVTELTVGSFAFTQANESGSTTLVSVLFPDSLTTLNIGRYAFGQGSSTSTSLTSVSFPSNLQTLNIGEEAFAQYRDDGTIAFKYAFLPSSHLPANTTVVSNAFPSEKPIYWLGATGTAFGVLPTGDEGSSPTLTQLPLTELTATPEETTQTVAVNTPLSFTNVQAVYGGGTDQPRYPETGTLPLSPTTSDELDFTKYKIISTVSGGQDENATVNDNSITFTSTGERTVTLSVPGFGEDVVKAYAVNVNPASSSNPSANNASTIGSVAQTGVPVNAFVATLLMLMLGAGFVRVRGKMV